jgi:hypothetical protein
LYSYFDFYFGFLPGCGGSSDDPKQLSPTPTPPQNQPPISNAGADQTVNENTVISLNGSGINSDGSVSSYAWVQTSGVDVTLSSPDAAIASFTTPFVTSDEILSFDVTVTDNNGAMSTSDAGVQIINASQIVFNNLIQCSTLRVTWGIKLLSY